MIPAVATPSAWPHAAEPFCTANAIWSGIAPADFSDWISMWWQNSAVEGLMRPRRCREATVRLGRRMRDYTTREKLKIAAGAISALVIVAWLAVLTIAFLAT